VHTLLTAVLDESHAEVALAISGIVAGLLFNPTRKQAQNLIDRQLYHLRFDLNELNRGQQPTQVKTPGLLTGRKLGEYEVLDVIGHGGMGEVYKGIGNDRVVAVKVLPQKFARQPEFRKRFAREADTMTLLEHPNIVKMYDYGETEDGTAYMVLEYIEGQELSDLLRQRGTLPFETVLPFIREFADALDYAHSKGFVHRDIKPSNIMVRSDADGQLHPVLMDFGVAKIQDAHTHLTGTGAVGTIDYMAPEQIREAGSVDSRADIYAMGLVLYEVLTGQRPFQGNPAQVMFAHLQQPPPDPRKNNPEIPGRVADTILRALAKLPDDRYPSAQAMTLALV
jgi:eukaryotic-like serine/threonine-protein kinase